MCDAERKYSDVKGKEAIDKPKAYTCCYVPGATEVTPVGGEVECPKNVWHPLVSTTSGDIGNEESFPEDVANSDLDSGAVPP